MTSFFDTVDPIADCESDFVHPRIEKATPITRNLIVKRIPQESFDLKKAIEALYQSLVL
jgi:hypothetical protein